MSVWFPFYAPGEVHRYSGRLPVLPRCADNLASVPFRERTEFVASLARYQRRTLPFVMHSYPPPQERNGIMPKSHDLAQLRILFVTSMHPSSPFPLRGVIVLRLAAALRALGHEVELVELGVGHPSRYVFARRRVANRIRAMSPDILHVHFGYSGLAVPHTPVPIVTTFNGDDLTGTPDANGRLTLKSRLGLLVSHYAAWRSARCIAVSRTLREYLWTKRLRQKTDVIRDAIDTSLFRPLSRQVARKRLGLPEDAVLVIFPHNAWEPRKRLWLAEAAVALLRESMPAAELWIVNGRAADEMPWYYAAADVMIVTSMFEGGPTATKEALACGLPVVSVAVGDLELFDEAPVGSTCVEDNPRALAAALRDMLERTPKERVNLLPPSLSLEAAARDVTALYRRVINERAVQRAL